MTGPRILVLDIETSPSLAYVWRLWKETIAPSQLVEAGQVISFAAQWHGERKIEFHADYDFTLKTMGNHGPMVQRAYDLIDEADFVVHWNGTSFDIPHLNREFLLAGLTPPGPHKNVDLLLTARKQFKFASNKLDFVARQLQLGGKVEHVGFNMWMACMAGEDAAWRKMRQYNRRDVDLTDRIYQYFQPWITTQPHVGLYSEDVAQDRCGRCGGKLIRRGFAFTAVGKYQRFQCEKPPLGCGGWSRGSRREDGVGVRAT